MNIQNAPVKLLDEIGREQAHESGQAHQIDACFLQRGNDLAIIGFAFEPLGWDDARGDFARGGAFQTRRALAIADDQADAGVGNASGGDAIGQSLEIGTASAEENSDLFGHVRTGCK